jgi:hypothetical protein
LIHFSDFVNEEDGCLVQCDKQGNIIHDAHKVIYPGANGDPWWDTKQLLTQITEAINIFNTTHPDCQALFVFDQSSAHASLGPDSLHMFDMNKSNSGKQQKQKDTVFPNNIPNVVMCGKPQKMTTDTGEAKGLEQVLQECGYETKGIWAQCSLICPFDNEGCCLACMLSKHDNFVNQISLLEELVIKAGHLCIFLLKFHCELNHLGQPLRLTSKGVPFEVISLA